MSKSYVDTLDTIAGALSGFESALNAHDKYGMMTGISQVISALGSSPLGLGGGLHLPIFPQHQDLQLQLTQQLA